MKSVEDKLTDLGLRSWIILLFLFALGLFALIINDKVNELEDRVEQYKEGLSNFKEEINEPK